jgi:hypothetical protein
MKRLLLISAVFLACLPVARAQLGIYAGYTAAKLDVANTDWHYGPTFGAYFDTHHFPVLNFGIDARASFINPGASSNSDNSSPSTSTKITSGLIGPRVILHLPVIPLHPYAEALAGIAKAQYGQGDASVNSTDLAYGFALGLDLTIFSHLDWRVIDFTYTRLQDTNTTSQTTLTTGLVLRIPFS